MAIFMCRKRKDCMFRADCPWSHGVDDKCIPYIRHNRYDCGSHAELYYYRAFTEDQSTFDRHIADNTLCPTTHSCIIQVERTSDVSRTLTH